MATSPHRRRPPAGKPSTAPKPAAKPVEAVEQPVEETVTLDPAALNHEMVDQDPPLGRQQLPQDAADRLDFVATLRGIQAAEIPYGQLLQAVRDDGWFLQLREAAAMPQHDGGTLVVFAMMMGPSPAYVQQIDNIAISVPPNTAAPSLWARANAYPSIIMVLFNLLPPAAAQPARTAEDRRADAELAADAALQAAEWEPIDLVEGRTADGLPLYFNPFDLTDDPDDMIRSFIASLEIEVPNIASSTGMAALFTENKDMFDYVRETQPATFDQIKLTILDPRVEELLEMEAPPTRQPSRTSGRRPAGR